jgi:hypothetical protein
VGGVTMRNFGGFRGLALSVLLLAFSALGPMRDAGLVAPADGRTILSPVDSVTTVWPTDAAARF